MKTIRLDLGKQPISKAIRQLEQLEKELRDAPAEIIDRLTEKGVEIAKDNASFMDAYDTGELARGIKGESKGDRGAVKATAPHSGFVEFGTGVRGKGSPHPNPGLANWKYDVNEHGEEGWFYQDDNGEWHWTAGMPSRPFMYNTAQELGRIAPDVMREVMRETLKD